MVAPYPELYGRGRSDRSVARRLRSIEALAVALLFDSKEDMRMTLRKRSTIQQSDQPRRVETRMAPSKRAERQHARPGAGIKRARAAMAPKPRSRG